MAAISLSDHYVLLLNNVVEENKALREQLAIIHENDQVAMKEMSQKVEDLATKVASSSSSGRRVRQCGGTVRVPKMCSNDVRRKIKALAKTGEESTLKVEESNGSEHNIQIFNKVREELCHEYGGEDKCPWTLIQIKAAYKTYLKSVRAYAKRTARGTNQAHNGTCRRQNRKREKLGRRLKSLTTKGWGTSRTAKVADVLTVDFMSSEESEAEDEASESTTAYVVRPLAWESSELKKRKKALDANRVNSLPHLVRRRIIKRKQGPPSFRPKPNGCPDWACNA